MFKKSFLSWFLFFSSTITFFALLWMNGFVDKLIKYDYTNISFLIIIIYMFSSLYAGKLFFISSKNGWKKIGGSMVDNNGNIISTNTLKSPVEIGYFLAEICSGLGLLGTVIGMLNVLLINLPSIDPSNADLLRQSMGDIGMGIGTAMLTTACGLTSSILLKCQFMMMDKFTDI